LKKNKEYDEVRFSADVLRAAFNAIGANSGELQGQTLKIDHDDETWYHDNLEEFLADYRKYQGSARVWLHKEPFQLTVSVSLRSVDISVEAPSRSEIEAVFDIFEKNMEEIRKLTVQLNRR
jgi:hypothetical protein